MPSLLHLRNKYQGKEAWLWALGGFILFIAAWWALAEAKAEMRPVVEGYSTYLPSEIASDSTQDMAAIRDSLILEDSIRLANATEFEKVYPLVPPPNKVVQAFPELYHEDQLIANTWLSVWRNLQGYFWAIFIALLIGIPLGLIPPLRALFSKQVDAMRYLPLTALTGLFILGFGIGDRMKVAFLAFGILVYLLPVVIQRINEVNDVYLKTVFTLGATNWQMVKSVYFPAILSKLMDDIRVLTAISWTYIIIAELLNRDGGVGAKIWINGRQGEIANVYAWLVVIIIVGFLQDRLFIYLDRRLFPHKYYKTVTNGLQEIRYGLLVIIGAVMLFLLASWLIPALAGGLQTFLYLLLITGLIAVLYGEFRFQRAHIS